MKGSGTDDESSGKGRMAEKKRAERWEGGGRSKVRRRRNYGMKEGEETWRRNVDGELCEDLFVTTQCVHACPLCVGTASGVPFFTLGGQGPLLGETPLLLPAAAAVSRCLSVGGQV